MPKNKNRIGIIGVYLGNFPGYMNLWLKSCAYNPSVDFLIFTDARLENYPENVYIIPTTLADIQKRASDVLGFSCSLERPYKLCDYKVIYGLIFQEYVASYDYWGHCDFDLIFGDLQGFFDRYNLYDYDRFHALGHLSLYRNTAEVNERFRLDGASHDYKTVYSSDHIFVFDEMPGMTTIYLKNGYPFFTKNIYADIASIYKRFRIIEQYALDEKPDNYPKQIFYWEEGKCYRAYFKKKRLFKEEYQYIHFKKRGNLPVSFDPTGTKSFYITPKGFFEKTGEVTPEIIDRLNSYSPFAEYLEFLKYYKTLIPGKIYRLLPKKMIPLLKRILKKGK